MNKVFFSSQNQCWCTPQSFFDELNKEFSFVLDPAATAQTTKCKHFFTPETDGLTQSWDYGGAVFCNEYAHIVADKDGNVIDDNVWGDFIPMMWV